MLKSIDHQKGEMMKKNMLLTKHYTERLMILGLYVLAIYLRYTLFSLHTSDYDADFSGWYDFIQSHGGFAALKYNFSNYNVSYFYLLTLGTYLPVPKMSMIKFIPVCFDLVMALFVYLIVRLKYQTSYLPTIASLVMLFLPTVFIMSGYWGQFESIYTSLSVGGLYFLFRKEPWWACVFFGLAISFKPQPIFFLPLLFVLLITGELPKKYVLIIPVMYLITVLPACLLGRGFIDVLTTYRSRADNPNHLLTLNAPTIFQWLPTDPFTPWDTAGFILALSAVGILSFVVLTSRRHITNEIMLKLALVFVVLIPFLMPEMHERYFYIADIVSFVYAFYFPKYFYVAILIELSSLMSYFPYLEGSAVIDLKYIAFLLLGVIIFTIWDLLHTLFSTDVVPSRKTQPLTQDTPDTNSCSERPCSNEGRPSATAHVECVPGNAPSSEELSIETLRDTHAVMDDLLCQKRRGFLKCAFNVIKDIRLNDHRLFRLIVALSAFLRFYRFPSLPPGLFQDEASAGYETYALLSHGTDRWGNPFPVYFPGWGSGQNVLLSYLNMPFIRVFGLTSFGERFSSALLGVLTIIILYAFVKKWYGTRTALVAAFLLGTNPWHIMISRWSLEANLLPCFLLLGMTSLSYCYTSKYAWILIPFSLVFLALSFYAYAVSIAIIPIFLALYFLFVGLQRFMHVWKQHRQGANHLSVGSLLLATAGGTPWHNMLSILLSFVIFFLIASPFFLFILDNYILHETPSFVQHLPFTIPLLIGNRLAQVSGGQDLLTPNVHFLLSGFGDWRVWNMADVYSPLGLLSFPLAALGIYYSISKRRVHANLFLIWLVSTIPLFFSVPLNINRANALFLPVIALSAIGISGLSGSIDKKQTKLAVVSLLLATVTLYNSFFCFYYFKNYSHDIQDAFNVGLDVALTQARSSASANEPIYVSNHIELNYIYTLFYLKADPLDFQKHSRVLVAGDTYDVLYYRNYYFDPNKPELTSAPSFVAILKGDEQVSCGHSQILFSEEGWTVERCSNQG